MKATDIQIGDWLQNTNGNIGIVRSIYRYRDFEKNELYYEIVMEYAPNSTCYSSLSLLKPIPLTPEILEKNGFKKDNDEVWPYYIFVADIEKCPQTIITFSFYGKGVLVETLFKCWTKPKCCDGENNIHICDLKYVHELQHALRICGITKEIIV